MEENKNLQPELSPEEQLDQLLAQFLDEPDPVDASVSEEITEYEPAMIIAQETVTTEEAPITAEDPEPVSSEAAQPDMPVSTEISPEVPADIPETASPDETPQQIPETPQPSEITPLEDTWIGEILDTPITTEEIGPDEQALAAVGLTQPGDPESEHIPQEVIREDSPTEEPTSENEELDILPILSPEPSPAPAESQPENNTDNKEPKEMANDIPAAEVIDDTPADNTQENTTPQKKRPKKKGTYGFFSIPHMLATVIWLTIIVFIGVGLGNILWLYASDMLAFGREENIVTITINADDDLDAVAEKLQAMGLIKYPSLFKLYANLSNAMDDINPGTYKLSTLYDYNALVDSMAGYSSRVTTKVTIPEGYTCAQIFKLLEEKGVCTVEELEDAVANAELGDYWFLEGVERGTADCLEGYLFPDTYQFYLDHDATSVIQKMLSNFNNRFTDVMKGKLDTLNETLSEMMRKNGMSEEYIAEHQMTIREVVIVASMIEKETANTAEGYTVASVIYNRLTNPNAYPHLQIDATLVYVTGHSILTADDLNLDTPYNTYKYAGLIPGPISNPSRASLDAALDPTFEDTDKDGVIDYYYYYALNPETGVHKFSKTLDEHEAFLDSLNKNDEETP